MVYSVQTFSILYRMSCFNNACHVPAEMPGILKNKLKKHFERLVLPHGAPSCLSPGAVLAPLHVPPILLPSRGWAPSTRGASAARNMPLDGQLMTDLHRYMLP